MMKVVENYILQDIYGSGEFGDIYKAKHIQNDEYFSVQMLNFDLFSKSHKLQEGIINEVQSLKKFDDPNILHFYKLLKTTNHIYLIYEYCDSGSLYDLLCKEQFFKEVEAVKFMRQVFCAVQKVHESNIVHCDLRLANILVSTHSVLKLSNFSKSVVAGNSKSQKIPSSNFESTQLHYLPPEA